MSDIEFISGLSFKAPNDNAPEYVKAKGSIKRADLIAWLGTKDGEWVNFDLKVSNGGKWYAAVDNWKPNGNGSPRNNAPQPARRDPQPEGVFDKDFDNSDIPFATNRSVW